MSRVANTMRLISKFTVGVSSMFTIGVGAAFADAVPGDFDGDGRSDFVAALVDTKEDKTAIRVRYADDGAEDLFTINEQGDAIVAGDFDGNGAEEIATVFVQSDANLKWTKCGPGCIESLEVDQSFGINRDRPVAGDFDCDGRDDFAVVRPARGGRGQWIIKKSSDGTTAEVLFGKRDDAIFAADMDHNGCDEMIVGQVDKETKKLNWYKRGINDTASTFISAWGKQGDTPLGPMDVNGDGSPDLIIVKSRSNARTFFVRYGAGQSFSATFGEATDLPLAGFFSGGSQAELALFRRKDGQNRKFIVRRSDGTIEELSTTGTKANILVRPDGVATSGSGGGGSVSCSRTTNFSDGGGGALWKPVSENTGKIVFLLPPSYVGRVSKTEIYGNSGSKLADGFLRSCCPNGGRPHFSANKTASALKPSAPITVKVTLNGGSSECRVVKDPTQRYD